MSATLEDGGIAQADEPLIPLTEAIGDRFSYRRANHWATRGVYGRKLKSIRVAGRIMTKRSWLAEFLIACHANSTSA